MRKIIFLFIALHGLVFGSGDFLTIDEYKTDIYFANGILTEHNASVSNTLLLEKAIRIKRYGDDEEKMYKYIGKVDYAYNRTDGFIIDNLESLAQKLDGTFISAVDRTNTIAALETLANLFNRRSTQK